MTSIYEEVETEPRVEQPTLSIKKRSKNRETLNTTEVREGRTRLSGLVDRAFNTLEDAMISADYNTAVKAAQIVLDRSGFGPKSTVDVNSTHIDLSEMTREQLADRAARLSAMLRKAKDAQVIDQVAIPQIASA